MPAKEKAAAAKPVKPPKAPRAKRAPKVKPPSPTTEAQTWFGETYPAIVFKHLLSSSIGMEIYKALCNLPKPLYTAKDTAVNAEFIIDRSGTSGLKL